MPEPTPTPTPPAPSFEDAANSAIENIPTPAVTPVGDPVVPAPAVVPATPAEPAKPAAEPELEPDPIVAKIAETLLGKEPPTPAEVAAVAAAAAAAAAAAPDSAEAVPGDGPKTPAAQKAWAELRQDRKWRKENEPVIQKLTQENEELKKRTTGDDPEKLQYKAHNDQLLAALRVRDVESTPEYIDNITKPMDEILTISGSIAKKVEMPESKVVAAIKETDPERQSEMLTEIAAGMNDRDKNRLFSMADRYGALTAQGKYLKDNSKIALETLQKDRQAAFNKQQGDLRNSRVEALNTVAGEFEKNLFLMQPIEGQETWNTGITQLRELATKLDPETMHPQARAKLIYQAILLPRAIEIISKLAKEQQSTRRALAKYRQAQPSGGAPAPGATGGPDLTGLTFEQMVEKLI
jgi:hypothetical protein